MKRRLQADMEVLPACYFSLVGLLGQAYETVRSRPTERLTLFNGTAPDYIKVGLAVVSDGNSRRGSISKVRAAAFRPADTSAQTIDVLPLLTTAF